MTVSQRILVVHLPAFRVERCGWSGTDVVALLDEFKSATRLTAVSPAAQALGLHYGMTASEARAREPDVVLEPVDLHGEHIDRLALAESLRHFSDRVGLLHEADLGLDVSATAHLFGGEVGLAMALQERITAFSHQCRIAVADDAIAAAALASTDSNTGDAPRIIRPGQSAAALAALPIRALSPTSALALSLSTIGISHIGDFAALDAASVSGRFGEEGVRLHRVARGGVGSGWLETVHENLPIRIHVQLGDAVVRLEPLFFALRGVIAQVCEQLFLRDQLATRLAIRLTLESGGIRLIRIRTGRPSRNPQTLLRVLHHRLEDLRLDAAATDLVVEVEEAAVDGGLQPGLHDRTEAPEPMADLIARLIDAVGEDAIIEPVLVDSWRPENAWRNGVIDGPAPPNRPSTMRFDPVEWMWASQDQLKPPRPTLLLPSPSAIEVRLTHGRPTQLHASFGWQSVRQSFGPERLQGEWWQDDRGFKRDYWLVELPQGTAWIYESKTRWFLHGWFD